MDLEWSNRTASLGVLERISGERAQPVLGETQDPEDDHGVFEEKLSKHTWKLFVTKQTKIQDKKPLLFKEPKYNRINKFML